MEPEETHSEAVQGDPGRTTQAKSTEFRRPYADTVASRRQLNELPPERAKIGVERQNAAPPKNAVVPWGATPGLRRRPRASFSGRRIAMGVSAGVLLAIGLLVHGPTGVLGHLTSLVSGVLPGSTSIPNELSALPQRTVTLQEESAPAIPSSRRAPLPPMAPPAQQPASAQRESTSAVPVTQVTVRAAPQDEDPKASRPTTPAPSPASVQSGRVADKVSETAATCSYGVAALGLCPLEAAQTQAATQIRSSTEATREPSKDNPTGECKEAAVALGLCAQ